MFMIPDEPAVLPAATAVQRRIRGCEGPSGVVYLSRPSRWATSWLSLVVLVAAAFHPALLSAQFGSEVTPGLPDVLSSKTILRSGGLEFSLFGVGRRVLDRDLRYADQYPNLESLNLKGANISGEGLVRLYDCRGLRRLNLSYTEITDDGISALPLFRELEELDLSHTAISDDGLRHLASCPHLTTLRAQSTNISGEGLRHLPEPLKLRTLDLESAPVDDEGVAQILAFKKLTKLRLYSTKASAKGLSHIKELRELRDLEFALPWSATSPIRLRFLGELKQLVRLRLGVIGARDEDVAYLKPLKQLECLKMSGDGISDEGLVHLSSLHQLRELRLAWPTSSVQVSEGPLSGPVTAGPLTDRGTKALGSLPHLKRLSLYGGRFSGSGAESLSTLSRLEYLNLQFTNITDDDLQHLDGLRSLKELDLGHTKVKSLPLPPLPNLETIDLRFTSLVGVDPARFAQLTNVRHLTLLKARLDDQSWRAIGQLDQLQELDLRTHDLSNDQLRYLLKNLVNLQVLSLGDSKVDDAAAALLLELKDLRWLDVSSTALRDIRNSELWDQLRERGVVVTSDG